MNARQRNKYRDYINCSHRVYNKEITADNPFYEIIEDYCKLHRYGLDDSSYEECCCDNCRSFTLSMRNMKKARALKAKIKAESKLCFYSPSKRQKKKRKTKDSFKNYFEFKKIKL